MTRVYFVRHAQPEHEWEEDRTRPLTEEGKKDSAIVLEFLLYYITKPEYHINVREKIYLDSMLDLF